MSRAQAISATRTHGKVPLFHDKSSHKAKIPCNARPDLCISYPVSDHNPAIDAEALLEQAVWLKRLARDLVGDPSLADDLTQETMLRALERPPRERRALRAWLRIVAQNLSRQIGRSEGARRNRRARCARPEGGESTADVVARADLHRRVFVAVMALAEPYGSTLLHRYF